MNEYTVQHISQSIMIWIALSIADFRSFLLKTVFGLMPHPERAMESILGSHDGVKMLQGFLEA